MKKTSELRRIILEAMRPRERLEVSTWSDMYSMLPSDSAEPGHYRTDRVPYFKSVMDAFDDVTINRVVVKSCSQSGKSSVLLNVVGYYAHQAPCTQMIIQPTLSDAMDFLKAA